MKHSSSAVQLKALFDEKLLPWASPGVLRWIVARQTRQELVLPPAVAARPRVMKSRAVSHRVPRQYRNASLFAKSWPDDHLTALRVPKMLCVISGRATIELGEYELEMTEGTFLFIPPGFRSPAHFHTLFRKRVGCSPAEFRRRGFLTKDDPEPIKTIPKNKSAPRGE